MDLLSFIHIADPTKVRIGKRQRDEYEPKILETTAWCVVPLLPVTPDRSSGEMEASVENLFGEGGSGKRTEQGDSASGGHGVGIDVVTETSIKDVAPAQLKRQKKQKTKVDDACEPSHPVKKLRDDYEAPGGPTVGGKSQLSIQHLLVEAVQSAKVRSEVIPTLPFVSSSVSTTPECEGGDHTELLAGANLRAIGAPQRFVISSNSSDHSGVNIAKAKVDYVVRTSMPIITIATPTADLAAIAKEKLVGSSVFGVDSPFVDESHPIPGGFFDCSGSDFLIGSIRTVIDPDSNLQKVYVPQWNVTNGFCLDDSGVCREMVDEFDSLKFFASVRGMDHDQLFTEFNVEAACQISLSVEVRMRAEYNIKERGRLKSVVEEKDSLLKSREQEVTDLDAVVTFVKLQNDSLADQNDSLADQFQVHKLEASSARLQEKVTVYENCMSHLEKFHDEKIEKAIEKGMQKGLSASITHGAEGRKLTDVATYNPSTEADYLFALQCLQSVNFSLIAKLKANKDARVEKIMNLLCLEDALAEKIGLVESQPNVDQLMVPIHHSLDQRIIGASALLLPLDVSSSRVWKIKENITNHVSDLHGVFSPYLLWIWKAQKVLSVLLLTLLRPYGQEDTGTGGETVADESVVPFPNVSDAELDVPECDLLLSAEAAFRHGPLACTPLFKCFCNLCFSIFALLLASRIAASSLFSSKRSKLISRASLFPTRDTSTVLSVGMPISARMIASVPYVNENVVSPLLDFIIVQCAHRTWGSSSIQFLLFASNLAFIPFPKLRFALFTRPLQMFNESKVESKPADNIVPHKFFDLIASDGRDQFCFNLFCKTSNALHNAIMEAGGKDYPPMLAWNPPYEYKWTDKAILVAEGSTKTTTERYMENCKNVSQDIRDQLNAEAEAIQIILTGIDNDIYSTVDACPNACEMWKAIKRLKQ
nr:hypothetical protein [Tanacetum cinerariifolium]